ncbi:MAG: 2-amino-4-hydroxy-6-hydroxymethyldihydropteridine diphosphokinase [Pedobacter sp.]|nr:MAG: 2-amino-4-hydroxy-6-hydroxymethyldihydropteridine diphosphokinase [Pedobacter sp.]
MVLDTKKVYLLLGSNLGDRLQLIKDASKEIQNKIGHIFATSSIYETEAWGNTNQPGFLNIALGVETSLSAVDVLAVALQIEQLLGRVRLEKWGARLMDIDLILYGDQIIDIPDQLQVPHPQMQNRKFVLEPLNEIAGAIKHPVLNKSISALLSELNDHLTVAKI